MGFEVPITIHKVIEGINSKHYVLPAIQREFVWNSEQIERLFASEVPTVQLADVLAFDLVECIELRQQLLEETDERRRVEQLVALLEKQFPDPGSLLAMSDRFEVDA